MLPSKYLMDFRKEARAAPYIIFMCRKKEAGFSPAPFVVCMAGFRTKGKTKEDLKT